MCQKKVGRTVAPRHASLKSSNTASAKATPCIDKPGEPNYANKVDELKDKESSWHMFARAVGLHSSRHKNFSYNLEGRPGEPLLAA